VKYFRQLLPKARIINIVNKHKIFNRITYISVASNDMVRNWMAAVFELFKFLSRFEGRKRKQHSIVRPKFELINSHIQIYSFITINLLRSGDKHERRHETATLQQLRFKHWEQITHESFPAKGFIPCYRKEWSLLKAHEDWQKLETRVFTKAVKANLPAKH
jgi:hypothetical protein